MLAVGSIGSCSTLSSVNPHLIAIIGLSFGRLFLHHFVDPFGRNKLAPLPHTAMKQQQTELSHRLALQIEPPTTRIIAFGTYLPLYLLNSKGRENTLSEEVEKRLSAYFLHNSREQICANRIVLKKTPRCAYWLSQIVAHP